MQRALTLEGSPPLSVPLRFLLAAPWFAAAAGALLAWHGEEALLTRWSPLTIALTHLVTLGFLAMAMAGALLQMLPVVAGVAVPRGAWFARLGWPMLGGGTLLLVAALLSGHTSLFAPAAAALALPLAALAVALAAALAHRAPRGALAMVCGMRLAVAALAVTAVLGVLLAAFLGGHVSVPALALTDIHAGWGLLGWVMMLVLAVAYQVIPMFQATPEYPKAFSLALPPLLALTLALWSAATLAGAAWSAYAGWAVALCVAAFAAATLALLARRRRPAPDATTFYWRLSMASLAACVLLYAVPGEPAWRALLVGVLFIVGFAMGAVNGMLYKIVPFLLWYHLQQHGNLPRASVPKAQDWIGERTARLQFWLHCAAVGLLCAAVLAPALARWSGLALLAASLRLAWDLCGAALRYRGILRRSALERA